MSEFILTDNLKSRLPFLASIWDHQEKATNVMVTWTDEPIARVNAKVEGFTTNDKTDFDRCNVTQILAKTHIYDDADRARKYKEIAFDLEYALIGTRQKMIVPTRASQEPRVMAGVQAMIDPTNVIEIDAGENPTAAILEAQQRLVAFGFDPTTVLLPPAPWVSIDGDAIRSKLGNLEVKIARHANLSDIIIYNPADWTLLCLRPFYEAESFASHDVTEDTPGARLVSLGDGEPRWRIPMNFLVGEYSLKNVNAKCAAIVRVRS